MQIKQAKGITLIALVITIIVLLILAGVAISMLTGENGILKQATSAKDTTDKSEFEEQVKLAVMAAKTNKTGSINTSDLETELNKISGAEITKSANNELPWTVKKGSYEVTITAEGVTTNTTGKDDSKKDENKIKPGTEISLTSTKGTTEKFYVLSYDESTQKAKALAKWNLMVGAICDSKGKKTGDVDTSAANYGLQDETMKGWISGQERKGTVAFSNSWYFKDTFASYPVDENGKSYVYDSNSNLYTYVNKYKELLGNTDKVSEVSLASYEDINALWSNKSNYEWLYSTSFWLGSAYSSSSSGVWTVRSDGYFSNPQYIMGIFQGVRPVITIDMSKI